MRNHSQSGHKLDESIVSTPSTNILSPIRDTFKTAQWDGILIEVIRTSFWRVSFLGWNEPRFVCSWQFQAYVKSMPNFTRVSVWGQINKQICQFQIQSWTWLPLELGFRQNLAKHLFITWPHLTNRTGLFANNYHNGHEFDANKVQAESLKRFARSLIILCQCSA